MNDSYEYTRPTIDNHPDVFTLYRKQHEPTGQRKTALLLRILRKEVSRCPPTHLRHLSPPSRRQQQRPPQALRRQRKARIYLQVLWQEVPFHPSDGGRTVCEPSQRHKQRGSRPGVVATI